MLVDSYLPMSNAMTRPDSQVCVVYPSNSKRMVKRDKELQQAVVAMVGGDRRRKLTVQDVRGCDPKESARPGWRRGRSRQLVTIQSNF
jgi:hypothetical protein